jgi:hypothetical protein
MVALGFGNFDNFIYSLFFMEQFLSLSATDLIVGIFATFLSSVIIGLVMGLLRMLLFTGVERYE